MNSAEGNKSAARGSSQNEASKSARKQRAEPEEALNVLHEYDMFTNRPTSTSSAIRRSSKLPASSFTLSSAALQLAYDRGSELATTAAVQIVSDKMEVVNIIANYGVEPSEILHLGKIHNKTKIVSF